MKKIFKILLVFLQVRYFQTWKSREQIIAFQKKKLKKQFLFFQKNSPYFKKHPIDKTLKMNKAFMMENFDALNTVGIKKEDAYRIAIESEQSRDFETKYNNISVGLSSGTSGHRSIFLTSEEEQAIWAGTILAKMLPKGLQRHKLAFFLRANNNLYKTINSYFIQLEYFDTFQKMQDHIDRLNIYQPSILIAPASSLTILATYQKERKLQIHPKKIISVAEVLEERDANYIKSQFGIKIIHQIYQATEGFLAYTCEYGNLHLNEDIISFEKNYIDEKRFYPIITDFFRKSQPFLHYHLNDILIESKEKCPCGSALQRIEKIEGRADDIFYFKDIQGKTVVIFPDFIRRCILFVDDIREYRVFQTSQNNIEIAVLDISPLQKNNILDEFQKLFQHFQLENIKISFIPYKIDIHKKLKRIENLMKEGTIL